jgi:hypothetical protein
MKTNELIKVIKTIALITLFQLINFTVTLYCINIAINKAISVAPRSIKRMKNFGTILKFLILNILFLISFKWRGVFEVINDEA